MLEKNAYICIGNSDNKLTQQEWAFFIKDVDDFLHPSVIHGRWFSAPDAPFQNACWCIDTTEASPDALKQVKLRLGLLGKRYKQDEIAWTEGAYEALKDADILRVR